MLKSKIVQTKTHQKLTNFWNRKNDKLKAEISVIIFHTPSRKEDMRHKIESW